MIREKRILLSYPHMSGEELKYIQNAFDINWIAPMGPHLELFEKKLRDYCKTNEAVCMNSGTSAIHIALRLLDIKPQDEILCSSTTFIASANPILYERATPVFIDSEPDTWNISPDALELAIIDGIKRNKKPKAAIIVHIYGYPAKMSEISNICNKYEIPIIEDAAEALGSTYKGKPCGSLGDYGVLSFNGNKIITTGGGGALLVNEKEKADMARFLITQARDKAPHYQHSTIGYNYRLSNILAAIGIGQMEVLGSRVRRRKDIFKKYQENLAHCFDFVPDREDSSSNRWLSTALIKDKKIKYIDLINFLDKQNIETRPLWKPLHCQPIFSDCKFFVHPSSNEAVSDKLFLQGLCLPSSSNLTDEEQDYVIEKIISFF